MHEKVLFYTDQEFKLEIILRKTIESRVGRVITPKVKLQHSKFTFSHLLNSTQRKLCVRVESESFRKNTWIKSL